MCNMDDSRWILFVDEIGDRCAVEASNVSVKMTKGKKLFIVSQSISVLCDKIYTCSTSNDMVKWLNGEDLD